MSRYGVRSSEGIGLARVGVAAVGLAISCIGLVSRCNADYDGAENRFKMTGLVVSTSEHEVEARIVSIDTAEGKAIGTLVSGETITLFDEYRHTDTWDCPWEDVGHLTDIDGQPIEEDRLQPGARVEFEGHIRDSLEGCGKNSTVSARPVYEQGTQIPG